MTPDQPQFRKAIFPGLYLQGDGALSAVPELMESLGGAGLVICAPSAFEKVLPGIADALPQGRRAERFGRECCEKELTRLSALVAECGARVVVAVGGGKTIDTAKIVADRSRLPVIVAPTIASTDAPCSACAIVYTHQGVFEAVTYQRRNPDAVVLDTGVISYLDQTRSKIAFENPGKLTYWTLSEEGRGGSIPEDGKNRACAA
jgi:glycerol dehydrogenase